MTYRIYLGGSFDPVHHAHLQMAITAFEQLSALHLPVTVTLLPTAGNPFKGAPTPTAHRLAMLTLATAHLPISIDEREIHEPPPVYTIDTVRQLRDEFADDVLIYLIGQDSLSSLPRWKSGEQLPDLVKFWAFTRVGETESIDPSISARLTDDLTRFLSDDGLIYQDLSPIAAMSSSCIRQLIADGKTDVLTDYLHPTVIDYIDTHQLYQDG